MTSDGVEEHHVKIMHRYPKSLRQSDTFESFVVLKPLPSCWEPHRPRLGAKFRSSRNFLLKMTFGISCLYLLQASTIVSAAVYQWTGGPFGSFFSTQSWQDEMGQNPSSLSSNQPLDAEFRASDTQLSTSSSQLLLGTGSLHLTNAALASGWPAQVAIIGNNEGPPSTVSLSGTSLLIASSLTYLDLQINGGSLVDLHATRSGHESGDTVLGSTINITEGGTFSLLYTDSSVFNPVTAEEVLAAYFPFLTYEGNPIELGLDPTVVEAGDNMVMSPWTSTSTTNIGGFPVTETWTSGWGFTPIPEPTTPLLATLASLLLLRRRRTGN
jgi:hypothetical protein